MQVVRIFGYQNYHSQQYFSDTDSSLTFEGSALNKTPFIAIICRHRTNVWKGVHRRKATGPERTRKARSLQIYKYSRRRVAICPGHLASPRGLPDCNPITSHTLPLSSPPSLYLSLSFSLSLFRSACSFVPCSRNPLSIQPISIFVSALLPQNDSSIVIESLAILTA